MALTGPRWCDQLAESGGETGGGQGEETNGAMSRRIKGPRYFAASTAVGLKMAKASLTVIFSDKLKYLGVFFYHIHEPLSFTVCVYLLGYGFTYLDSPIRSLEVT